MQIIYIFSPILHGHFYLQSNFTAAHTIVMVQMHVQNVWYVPTKLGNETNHWYFEIKPQ